MELLFKDRESFFKPGSVNSGQMKSLEQSVVIIIKFNLYFLLLINTRYPLRNISKEMVNSTVHESAITKRLPEDIKEIDLNEHYDSICI